MAKMNPKTKKTLLIISAIVVLAIVGIVIWRVAAGRPTEEQTPVAEAPKKRRISVPSNIIPVSQRPFTELIPFDKNGRNLRVQVNNLPLVSETAEYLIEYAVGKTTAKNAGGRDIAVPEAENVTGIQGSMGELFLTNLPSTAELLLGTCSAGGACTHHSGLSTGILTVTYQADEPYATSQKFNYFEKYDQEAATEDGHFILTSNVLSKTENFVIINSAGLPDGLTGEAIVITDPTGDTNATIPLAYQLAFTTKPTPGSAEINFNYAGATDPSLIQIFAYDDLSQTWSPLETTNQGNKYTATDTKINVIYALVVNAASI